MKDEPNDVERSGPRVAAVGPLLFAGDGRDPRRRRVADAALAGAATGALVVAGLASNDTAGDQSELVSAVKRLLGWLEPMWAICYGAASVVCAALVVVALAAGRRALARDIAAAVGLTLGVGAGLGRWVDGAAPGLSDMLWAAGDPSYPAVRVALVCSAALVASPELTRPARRSVAVLVAGTAVAALVLESAYPSHVLGGLGLGLAVGALVRVAFGSPAGFPTVPRVAAAVAALGIEATGLRYVPGGRGGAARYVGHAGRRPVSVLVYGRDARDAQVLARLWHQLWYRDPGPAVSLTRREQVEHEALMLVLARRAGVPVPEVVAAGSVASGDAVLVTDQPPVSSVADLPAETITDGLLTAAWGAARGLRQSGIGHGRLNASAILAVGNDVLVTDLAAARLGASADVLATDAAELLVSCALLVGESRAVAAAATGLGDAALRDAVPFVQHAALSPGLREAVRASGADVDHLRRTAASAVGADVPEVAELRRVRPRDVAVLALTLVAAYTLLTQLADVGFDTIVDELAGAELGWVLFGLAFAQLTLVCDAAATIAAVGMPLPRGPTTLLQSAVKFVNLSVPSVAGKLALTVRFLQRQGVDRSVALSQGALDGLAGLVVQAAVLIVTVPLIDIHVDPGDRDGSALVWVGIALIGAVVVAAVVAALAPSLRARVAPAVRAAVGNVRGLVASPQRLARLVLANVGSQLVYAMVLGVALRSLGAEASLAELLFVNTAVTLFAGVVPVPGGIGVAEAGLTAALVAVGVPEETALGAALLHRLLTYYLPPVWGFAALRWLGHHGFV